jgi:hypothetical protein
MVRPVASGYGTNDDKVFTMSTQGARRTYLTWPRAPTRSEEGGRLGRSSPVRDGGAGQLRWSGEVGHASGSCSEVIRCSDHVSRSWSEVGGEVSHTYGSCSEVGGEVCHASGSCSDVGGEVCHASGSCSEAGGEVCHAFGSCSEVVREVIHTSGSCSEVIGCFETDGR